MHCPACDSTDFIRYRLPVERHGSIFRRHRCRNCRRTFLTVQKVVLGMTAERLLDLMEGPVPSSELTQSASATSGPEARA